MGVDVQPVRYVPPEERLASYMHIPHLGDPGLYNLLKGYVVIEEKLDGSLFRWQNKGGKIMAGSRSVNFSDASPPPKGFAEAVRYLESIVDRIPQGFVFFGELLANPKQNAITYSQVPTNHIMLFDMWNMGMTDPEWMPLAVIRAAADRMQIDPPMILYEGLGQGDGENVDGSLVIADIERLLARTSYLGGSIIEGVVIKNYGQPSADRYHLGGFCAGKMVRASFKEENRSMWKAQADVVAQIATRFRTPGRFEKALVHARDSGLIAGGMSDMRGLLAELDRDIEEEIRPAALEMLWKRYEHQIGKAMKTGLAEWYKQKLLEQQFSPEGQRETAEAQRASGEQVGSQSLRQRVIDTMHDDGGPL